MPRASDKKAFKTNNSVRSMGCNKNARIEVRKNALSQILADAAIFVALGVARLIARRSSLVAIAVRVGIRTTRTPMAMVVSRSL